MTKNNPLELAEPEQAYKYCETITKTHAKSFYFAAKFLPKHKRKPIYALYALCRKVDDEVDEIGENNEHAAVKAVEKWQRQLEEIYSEKSEVRNRNSEVGNQKSKTENLVFLAWRDLLKKYKIPKKLPLELMQGVLMDTHIKRYETFGELYVYCYRVASTVGLMSSEIFGYTEKITLEYAEALGIAMQLTNILRDVKEDAAMGRIYLPQEDLRRFNITEKQILASKFDENFVELMKFQIERARDYYRKSEKGIPLLEKDTRFTVLLASRIYGRILDEIERQNYDVFKKRAHTTFSQKMLTIPKIWRESKRF